MKIFFEKHFTLNRSAFPTMCLKINRMLHTQVSVELHLFTPVVIANIRTYGTGGKNQG